MISVGCNDRRKGLGLGFGGGAGGREMEATEIEEGEALVHQNDADSTVDPDVALAYLDEKLEHVLGHFQKDFEGGVSAENLGSKFGGYGSFLPTYQRSPTWSHARTPPNVQNHSASRSPTNLPVEVDISLEAPRGNSISSSASLSARHGLTALGMETVPPHRASSVENCVKQERTMPFANADNKADNQSDQKTFKVRIKMGSDNLSTKNNAEIYSGLGLDVSPTSSFEDSPTDGGLTHEPRNSPEESPTSILQIMTSFPLHGSLLLSPLHDDLISLTDKEMLSRGSRSVSIRHKGSQEGSLISINGSDSGVSDRKHVRDKKPKSSEKKAYSVQSKNNNIHNTQSGVDVLSKKETDADTSLCDELVSSAMRLPLLSNSHGSIADSSKDTAKVVDISRAVNTGAMEESFCDPAKDQPWGPASIQENGFVGKSSGKAVSAVKVSESKKPYAGHDASGYPEKGGNHKSNKIDTSSKVDPDMTKVRKGFAPELMDYAKNKSGQKAISSVDDDKNVSSGKENSSSVGKKKSKGNQSHVIEAITEVQNVKTQTSVVSAPKSGKTANLNGHISEVEDSKQDIGKAKDRYKDFFGDLDLDNDIAEDGVPSIDKSTNCPVFDKGNGEFDSSSKDRSGSKKIDQSSTSEAYTRASSLIPPTGNRLNFDAGAPIAPLVQEDWVGCDKCQKWRLLPAGKNPQSLPKIWLCSMLDWLDGMNRCSVSEEETTRAVLALHQAPAPVHEGQSIQNRYAGVASSVVDALHVDQSLQDISGKKKHGSREVLNASSQNGSSAYLNSKKQIPHASAKNRSLNGENHSPSLNEVGFQLSGQPSPLLEQKRRHKREEKSIPLTNLGEGDTKSSKIRNKRENNPEFLKVSKKLKTSAVHIDEDWKSDNGGAASKVGRNSSNVTSISNKTGKHRHRYDHPKDSMRDSKVSVRNAENRTEFPSDARLLHMENYADGDAKKRKIIDYQEDQLYTATRSTDGHRLEDHRDFLEETSESNHRKEKKSRVSKSGGRESSMSKGSAGIEKKGWRPKDQPAGADLENSLFCRSLDAINLVKKDVGFAQPPVAATSSSSKVSGSRKSKTKLQEAKGSPAESVSSSPLRVFNQDKFTLTSRDLGGKGDSEEAIILATSSPKKCLVGEDGIGSDQSRALLKNETPITINGGGCNTQDRNQSHVSRRKTLAETASSPEFATHYSADILQSDQHRFKHPISEQCPKDESGKKDKYHNNGSRRKSGKGSSSRSKDKSRGTRSESEKGNLKAFDSNGHAEHSSYDKNSKARSKLQERTAPLCEKSEKNIFPKNDPAANPSTEIGRREAQSKRASFGSSDGRQVIPNHDSKQNLPVNCNSEKSSNRFPSDKTDQVDVSGKGKSHSLPPSGRGQNELTRWPQPVNGNQKDNGVNLSTVSTSEGGDALKAAKDIKRSENQNGNGNQPITSQNSINGHKGRDIDAPSPVRRDSSIQTANNAVKEAKDLKHLADRLKNSGTPLESTGYYFQAALKFLYGASLFESCNNENAKHGEMIQSMQMYSSTAKLCEFCAHEYEKSKDMASASLAYKCAEVAYFRVINFSHISASRDRQEMQNALQIVPPGESPSSSASDVDNMNNAATTDKVTLNKGVNSPQIAGNHVITARSRPNFVRLLNFVQDVNFAMEASRKSRIAFSAANSREETRYREGLPSVKKALDYNFYDVEELLRLMRLAMEAISR